MDLEFGWLTQFLMSPWFALVAGVGIQVVMTQQMKFWLPLRWSDLRRRRAIQLIGLACGYFPTLGIMHGIGAPAFQLQWFPVFVAITGPVIYRFFMAWYYDKVPSAESRFSAHHHAIRRRNGAA